MLTLIVWWAGILLEAVILARIFRNGVLQAQPIFASYLVCVLASSVSGYIVYETSPPMYRYWYWGWEFVCVLAGYGLVLEVLEKSLGFYEGPKRFARSTGLAILALIVGFTASRVTLARGLSAIRTSAEVERDLRSAELILLAVIILVIRYYSIPIGRNMKGVIAGYGLFVSAIVVDNALRSYVGSAFQPIFSAVRSYSYLIALLVWSVALWSYDPNPVPQAPTRLPADYASLARMTRSVLSGMRGHVGKVAPP